MGEYYEKVISELRSWDKFGHLEKPQKDEESKLNKLASNYLITELQKIYRERDLNFDIDGINITPENFGEFVFRIHNGEISSTGAQTLLKEMFETGKEPKLIIEEKDLAQTSDLSSLTEAVMEVVAENEKSAKDYKKGNKNAIEFLLGRVMAKTKGKANPGVTRGILEEQLK